MATLGLAELGNYYDYLSTGQDVMLAALTLECN